MKTPYPTDCPPDNQRETDYEPVYATLHFYYNDPDSMRRMRECLDAPKWKSAVREFDQWIRGLVKYGEVTVNEESIRERFHVIFGEHGIDIWED